MHNTFFKPLHQVNPTFSPENMHLLNGEDPHPEKECTRYENLITEMGGIDLQILGLGVNGHIAFNEPGTGRQSRTRKIQIDDATIKANSRFFNGHENTVPTEALTMGIATILETKEIFLLVHGPEKKTIFEKLKNLETPTEAIPASYLLVHPHVTVFSDLS
jgi:glucosamine-6-phosphate deaminase